MTLNWVNESCGEVSLCVRTPREACAYPLTLPLGPILHTLTVLALLPGAAPPIQAKCMCLPIYIKAATLKGAGLCQRKQIS